MNFEELNISKYINNNEVIQKNVDKVLDNSDDDNIMLSIPQDNVYMEFDVKNQIYVAFTEKLNETDEIEMMFARVEIINGDKKLKCINNSHEYDDVLSEFNRILELMFN